MCVFFGATALFLSSCQKNDSFLDSETQQTLLIPQTAILVSNTASLRIDASSKSTEAEEFAKLLAVSLKQKEMRNFIKTEANKKFDGDFDILVSKVIEAQIGNEKFGEKLKKNSPNGYAKGKETFDNALKNPKLNIAIPVLIEKWDDTKQQPLVAVAVDADEKQTQQLKAYDSDGRLYLLDAKTEPNVPVIVIANNERMDYKPIKNTSQNLRISGNSEKITALQCPNLSAIESWYYGGPELRFEGVVYDDTFSSAYLAFSKTQHPPRDLAVLGFSPNQELFEWHFDNNHGPDYYIQSWEIDDSGTTAKLTVGVSAGKKDQVTGTASFELSYKAQDKKLAGELIHYTSSTPKTIADSYIWFVLGN